MTNPIWLYPYIDAYLANSKKLEAGLVNIALITDWLTAKTEDNLFSLQFLTRFSFLNPILFLGNLFLSHPEAIVL